MCFRGVPTLRLPEVGMAQTFNVLEGFHIHFTKRFIGAFLCRFEC